MNKNKIRLEMAERALHYLESQMTSDPPESDFIKRNELLIRIAASREVLDEN